MGAKLIFNNEMNDHSFFFLASIQSLVYRTKSMFDERYMMRGVNNFDPREFLPLMERWLQSYIERNFIINYRIGTFDSEPEIEDHFTFKIYLQKSRAHEIYIIELNLRKNIHDCVRFLSGSDVTLIDTDVFNLTYRDSRFSDENVDFIETEQRKNNVRRFNPKKYF